MNTLDINGVNLILRGIPTASFDDVSAFNRVVEKEPNSHYEIHYTDRFRERVKTVVKAKSQEEALTKLEAHETDPIKNPSILAITEQQYNKFIQHYNIQPIE